MKKWTTLLLAAAFLSITTSANAQSKTGYIDIPNLVVLMPEFKTADTLLAEYQNALREQYADMITEYNTKDSLLSSKDTVKYTRSQLEIKRRELGQLYIKLQGWNRSAQQMYNNKETELMTPVQSKLIKAVETVAKENGYGYVLNRSALAIAPPPADDLLPLVKKKLGIK